MTEEEPMPKPQALPPRRPENQTVFITFCRSSVLNVLRILNSIDKHELVAAGVVNDTDMDTRWEQFRGDPFRTFMRMSDDDATKLWTIILGRIHN